ncbi:class I SAM-dependent methyltransferase [Dokdonia sinensis]|uniref:Class I SAM-dependent methyltransferase n=1 Tax=Dokdonia sinensis TaxID=2479847 RepID=A0A3M0GFR9_9FLAO|nr:class I SAM-dependent methyltransferase [Dokdonia sinensis]RMB63524.1 class I SAM-dependent methyltransferase [Dokdonia sinensis]
MRKDFKVKDHSVSGERFLLRYDESKNMFVTEPKPSKEKLPSYYASEDYISHTDNKRNLTEWMYQIVKRYTLSQKRKLINSYLKNKNSLIDIGAGTGDFAFYMSKDKWEVLGIEPDKNARALAEKKGVITQPDLPTANTKYDCITLWHVLEHVYDLEKQIEWIKKHLTNSGYCFVAVPNFESHDANHYGEYWAAYDVPRHLYHFSNKAIASLFKEHHLEVVREHPMKFDAFYVALLSEKYKNGKMNFLSAFRRGWRSNRLANKSGAYSSLIYAIKHEES